MIKFELLKVNQEAVIEKIIAKHLESVIEVIKKADFYPAIEKCVEFDLSHDDAVALMKEISIIASKLEIGTMAGRLWESHDCIDEALQNSKG